MGTYKEFLEWLGLTHGSFTIILIALFLLLSFLMLLKNLGFLSSITFKQLTLPKSKFLYKVYQGSYQNINFALEQMIKEANLVFKISNPFGIYYEAIPLQNESSEEKLNKARAALGIRVKQIQYEKIKMMNQKFPDKYKLKQTPVTICVGTQYPYFNAASLVMIINRVYPRLAEFIAKKKLLAGPGVLEQYCVNDKKPYVNIMIPLENYAEFLFE